MRTLWPLHLALCFLIQFTVLSARVGKLSRPARLPRHVLTVWLLKSKYGLRETVNSKRSSSIRRPEERCFYSVHFSYSQPEFLGSAYSRIRLAPAVFLSTAANTRKIDVSEELTGACRANKA